MMPHGAACKSTFWQTCWLLLYVVACSFIHLSHHMHKLALPLLCQQLRPNSRWDMVFSSSAPFPQVAFVSSGKLANGLYQTESQEEGLVEREQLIRSLYLHAVFREPKKIQLIWIVEVLVEVANPLCLRNPLREYFVNYNGVVTEHCFGGTNAERGLFLADPFRSSGRSGLKLRNKPLPDIKVIPPLPSLVVDVERAWRLSSRLRIQVLQGLRLVNSRLLSMEIPLQLSSTLRKAEANATVRIDPYRGNWNLQVLELELWNGKDAFSTTKAVLELDFMATSSGPSSGSGNH
ncbi:hypothetical protein SELMODRAFT_403810 [Selaginella moellendorffii]|uniref:Uncharacterized protein n=1 Tax=Selaginella moellendorffii TaxID=88036 RepID=D8QSL6_SELML|nr:hypothetical protein SELMODRAFT_403810 [Selaginella moellendorffii]